MYRSLSLFVLFTTFSCVQAQEDGFIPQFANETNAISGFLKVPENRNDPNTREIELAYVVLKANASAPKKDPIVYLMGGPGGAATYTIGSWRNSQLRRDRDFVIFDQRGTGLSASVCDDLGSEVFEMVSQDLSPAEEMKALLAAANACKVEMNSVDHDQAGYNTPENVKDLEALRVHLGYKQWNLFGTSYGSTFALAYMREFPQNVRTSIMAALAPPQINYYADFSTNFRRSLHMVFEACTNDKSCLKKYPNLKKDFYEVLEGLKSKPFTAKYNGKPFVLNAQDMLMLVQQHLYSKPTIEQLPALITAIKGGNSELVNRAIAVAGATMDVINVAMHWSFVAYDEYGGGRIKTASLDDLTRYPELNNPGPAFFTPSKELIESWHAFREEPILSEPVSSDIPSLLANGVFDPITPPAYAKETLKYLSNAFYVEFPTDGHSTFNPCYFGIIEEFLEHPEKQPNLGCAASDRGFDWR
ncbi:alpha/beta hydrolase [Roseivirga sp. E12]|uniref:alpha/beta hydrolase n=1 Tax=Roseivirga sp. E12 TaxID=2819237 RepID=UPI001ABD2B14|nr:alpha/beta hydrolase [Roseivirga sp. E12]MBO3699489.1 alpha/beta fold hydrolase [Roseivirga sp. E12]